MNKVSVVLYARLGSTRIPNKSAMDFAGKPAFVHTFERVLEHYPSPDYCFLATTDEASDDPLATLAKTYGYSVFRYSVELGARTEALRRYIGFDKDDIEISVGGDSPFVFCEHIPFAVQALKKYDAKCLVPIMRGRTLLWASCVPTIKKFDFREEVRIRELNLDGAADVWIQANRERTIILSMPGWLLEPWPWSIMTLDLPEQGSFYKLIYLDLYKGHPLDIRDVRTYMAERPAWTAILAQDLSASYAKTYDLQYLSMVELWLKSGAIHLYWKGGNSGVELANGQTQPIEF